MLCKRVYSCQYMDGWKRFNEISLSEKKKFHSNISKETIADASCKNAKRYWEILKQKI